ncbi:hypothetical protein V6N12_058263 [Hibiscus sabdariffa]|uniref:Uncharacterized protein n=1 Tax=Hibiscus sabdariffa TaxID=183260 RepID=A0ABR2ES41_9ROSI
MPNEWHTPLEVPGNRLPETGSRRKLLNVRGAWDKPVTQKMLCRDLNSSRDFCRGRTRCLCRDIPFVILFKQIVEALA